MTCPVCASRDAVELFPNYEGRCITSDMQVLPETTIRNRVCRVCGFIFDAAGVRGRTDAFYRSAYSLRMHAPDAKNINFSGHTPTPLAALQLHFLLQSMSGKKGHLLEIGAGKGDFIGRFVRARPGWGVTAIEPSGAAATLAQRLPSVEIHDAGFRTFVPHRKFDVISALGVLEHVEQPIELLQWVRARLTPDGLFFLSFPNFEANPNDLFCVDHLSKITPASMQMLARRAGFEVERSQMAGVGLLTILRPANASPMDDSVFDETIGVGYRNGDLAKRTLAAIDEARIEGGMHGFAIFGLGIAGIFAPFFVGFDPEQIVVYVDENDTMHGTTINGRPVVGLSALSGLKVGHVAIAASPIYHRQMRAKLEPLGVIVHV